MLSTPELSDSVLDLVPVMPVVVVEDPATAVPLARALVAGGLPAIELTLRTPGALEAIRSIAAEVPEILLGAGTVTTPELAQAAARAGAKFLVSPGATERLLGAMGDTGLPFLPGTATLSEMLVVLEGRAERDEVLSCRGRRWHRLPQGGGRSVAAGAFLPHRRDQAQHGSRLPCPAQRGVRRRYLDHPTRGRRRGGLGPDHGSCGRGRGIEAPMSRAALTDRAIGIDFGATGIKAALVDCRSGELLSERHRLDTPTPATPQAVKGTVEELLTRFDDRTPVGLAVPGVVRNGVVCTAANIDHSWIGVSLPDLLEDALDVPAAFLNDADAAGLAEVALGSARDHPGLVIVLTVGTGIGGALLYDGRLVPNAELGHLEVNGVVAETVSSGRALAAGGNDWESWTVGLSEYLRRVEDLFWPDLMVIGGGVASTPEPWFGLLETRTELRLATHGKSAGLVGAARAAFVSASAQPAGTPRAGDSRIG